jgi:hypothetical protein
VKARHSESPGAGKAARAKASKRFFLKKEAKTFF